MLTAESDKDNTVEIVRAGIVIDDLIGRQQVMIQTLGEAMNAIPGIAGGAMMPNGRAGSIVDVGSLVRFANTGHGEGATEEHEIRC